MNSAEEALLVEIAVRDSRHLNVIMAMDRLNILPASESDLKLAMDDLDTVRKFFSKHLPVRLREPAKAMFIEHAKSIESHFRSKQYT